MDGNIMVRAIRNRIEVFVGFLVRSAKYIRLNIITTLTDEQKLHYNGIISDENKLAYQQELREETITNRRTKHTGQFPLSDNLMPLIFQVQVDQTATT